MAAKRGPCGQILRFLPVTFIITLAIYAYYIYVTVTAPLLLNTAQQVRSLRPRRGSLESASSTLPAGKMKSMPGPPWRACLADWRYGVGVDMRGIGPFRAVFVPF